MKLQSTVAVGGSKLTVNGNRRLLNDNREHATVRG